MDNRASLLIVDDERGPTESLRMVFKSEYDVFTAPGGQEALEILHAQAIDVVTLDLRMPGMPGVEVMEHIKRHDPDIEIIVVTGYASLDSAVRGLRNRVFDYVTKPFDVPQISDLVHRAVQRR
ncbi:MAG: response regulator, partial [bacterium]